MMYLQSLKGNKLHLLLIGELIVSLYTMLTTIIVAIYWQIDKEYDFLYYFAVYSTGAIFVTLAAIDAVNALVEAYHTLKWIKSQDS